MREGVLALVAGTPTLKEAKDGVAEERSVACGDTRWPEEWSVVETSLVLVGTTFRFFADPNTMVVCVSLCVCDRLPRCGEGVMDREGGICGCIGSA